MEPDERAVQLSINLPYPANYVGDLCAGCLEEFEAALAKVLDKYVQREKTGRRTAVSPVVPGAPKKTASKARGALPDQDRTCPLCARTDHPYVAITRSALGQHLKAQHQTGFRELGMVLVRKSTGKS